MERLIRLEEVQKITSLSESDIKRRIKADEFPGSVKIGPRRVAWVLSEVKAWVFSVTGIEEVVETSDEDESPIAKYRDRIEERDDGCWIWLGASDGKYGHLKILGTRINSGAHRVIYEAVKGKIPDGLQLDHLCRVTMCVNPDHLEPVTRQENMRRSHRDRDRVLKTHCKNGHEYTKENTAINKRGNRHCKICQKARTAQRRENNASI